MNTDMHRITSSIASAGAMPFLSFLFIMLGALYPQSAMAATAPGGSSIPEIYLFFGRFHPAVLHFPIAILMVLFLMEFSAIFKTSPGFDSATWFLLLVGCLAAIVSAVFGVFLSWGGEYDADTLFWHKWQGIGVAVLSAIAVITRQISKRNQKNAKAFLNVYRGVLLICVIVITLAGHNGASMTHGSNYLQEYMPDSLANLLGIEKAQTQMAAGGGDVFSDSIQPILQARCFSCHGPDKQASRLRIDDWEAMFAGGSSGKAGIVPGNAAASEIVNRILLPAEHMDVMPPEGKGSLSADEVMAIVHWVNRGAPAPQIADAAGEAGTATPIAAATVDFATQIMPILEANCFKCHGSNKQKAELRFDTEEWLDPVVGLVTPGSPEESLLYELVNLPHDDPGIMPAEGDPLTPEQLELIRTWIMEGASSAASAAQPTETAVAPAPAAASAPVMAAGASIDFASQILPILEERCMGCHGPDRQKGGLRFDLADWLTAGNEADRVVIPGNPDESNLLMLVSLPANDPDIMPAKGDTLADEQIQLIRTWIEQGASFGDWPAGAKQDTAQKEPTFIDLLQQEMVPLSEQEREILAGFGIKVMPIAQNSPLISANLQGIANQKENPALEKLEPLASRVVWLNLAATKLAPEDLKVLSAFQNLTHLHLEHTNISDNDLSHISGLEHLRYLNLYNTAISDSGLAHLQQLTNLKEIYLWQTKATEEGMNQLRSALPQVEVVLGPQVLPDDQQNEPPEDYTEEG